MQFWFPTHSSKSRLWGLVQVRLSQWDGAEQKPRPCLTSVRSKREQEARPFSPGRKRRQCSKERMGIRNSLLMPCVPEETRGWSLSSVDIWGMGHNALPFPAAAVWVLMSPPDGKLSEDSMPLPPLLLCPCPEDLGSLEDDITMCHLHAVSVVLRIIDPSMPLLTNFVKQMCSSLFVTTSLCPGDFYMFFPCHWAWTFLPGWLQC